MVDHALAPLAAPGPELEPPVMFLEDLYEFSIFVGFSHVLLIGNSTHAF
jgi:hypothetical protein